MKTILILTDFSTRSDHAAHYAVRLAQNIGANILLCNMFRVPSAEPLAAQVAWPAGIYETYEDDSVDNLAELAERLNRLVNSGSHEKFRPSISCISKAGNIADNLDEVLAHHHILMAVMSTHNEDGIRSFLLGNNAREVIEHANCPVLLVPDYIPFHAYKKIAFATDLSDSDIDVVHSLAGLARYSGSEILITHVSGEKAADKEHTIIENFFTQVSSKINYPMIYYREIENKSVTDGLRWLAEQPDIDMLVLVHRKLSFFKRLFEASVTQNLAYELTKPILVFPFLNTQEALPVF